MANRALHNLGATPRKGNHPCNLCGQFGKLTRTHVPAKAAGNRVRRSRMVSANGRVIPDPDPRDGGLYVFAHCRTCNGDLQAQYDPAYAEMANGLRHLWVPYPTPGMPLRHALPAIDIMPGAIARTVLIGFFALAPKLRALHPGLADSLVRRDPAITLPPNFAIHLALSVGTQARIAGPFFNIVASSMGRGARNVGVRSSASIYFPPLAWQFAPPDDVLLTAQGWANVSDWLSMPADRTVPLRTVCPPTLPMVWVPEFDPMFRRNMVSMGGGKIAEIVMATDVPAQLFDRA
ncbi:hypothetical protein [Micromonospora sp. NPDC048830]|uniref:hypothetical protein n=1 Tax=Micromonospora sp. NPDC048830 TaxID=3364257 RepID=UPI003722BFA2